MSKEDAAITGILVFSTMFAIGAWLVGNNFGWFLIAWPVAFVVSAKVMQ